MDFILSTLKSVPSNVFTVDLGTLNTFDGTDPKVDSVKPKVRNIPCVRSTLIRERWWGVVDPEVVGVWTPRWWRCVDPEVVGGVDPEVVGCGLRGGGVCAPRGSGCVDQEVVGVYGPRGGGGVDPEVVGVWTKRWWGCGPRGGGGVDPEVVGVWTQRWWGCGPRGGGGSVDPEVVGGKRKRGREGKRKRRERSGRRVGRREGGGGRGGTYCSNASTSILVSSIMLWSLSSITRSN